MDKKLELIIKYIRMANHPSSNENEANIASRKACKLLEEINFAEMKSQEQRRPVPPAYQPPTPRPAATSVNWNVYDETSPINDFINEMFRNRSESYGSWTGTKINPEENQSIIDAIKRDRERQVKEQAQRAKDNEERKRKIQEIEDYLSRYDKKAYDEFHYNVDARRDIDDIWKDIIKEKNKHEAPQVKYKSPFNPDVNEFDPFQGIKDTPIEFMSKTVKCGICKVKVKVNADMNYDKGFICGPCKLKMAI